MIRKELYFTWAKGQGGQLSANLHAKEFECPCKHPSCIEQRIAVAIVDKCQAIRNAANSQMRIHSGFRCRRHQGDLSKQGYETAKGLSQHELGRAVDFSVSSIPAGELKALAKPHFKALGIASNFIHGDLRDDKDRTWNYGYVVRA